MIDKKLCCVSKRGRVFKKNMLCLFNYYAFLLTTTLLLLEVRAVSYRVIGYQSPDKVSMVHNPQTDADKAEPNIKADNADPNIKADTTILQVPEQNIGNLDERLCRPGYKMDKFKRCRAVW
ncbi:uncharacterized protein LOC111054246 [Nilaparvata lugens]|uniref:uncharacterized protein LOC111054246 n=1 Tax=Nilaparvata lugens TaxID=108931 RepID=UPI00193CB0F5|nr:uncharacterized protein LOC111054246 [Nilaparvata lugens]